MGCCSFGFQASDRKSYNSMIVFHELANVKMGREILRIADDGEFRVRCGCGGGCGCSTGDRNYRYFSSVHKALYGISAGFIADYVCKL
jgi:hypothetical protein